MDLVYKIPYRRACAWPCAREQRYLAYKNGPLFLDLFDSIFIKKKLLESIVY